ncbi:hypothetical protein QYF36_020071 [Acer negundo]|nr:hypothetical protein QYF36_020071 [Acer negundo]
MTPFQGVSFRRPRWVSGVPDDSERAVAREVSLVSWESEFHATQKSVEGSSCRDCIQQENFSPTPSRQRFPALLHHANQHYE